MITRHFRIVVVLLALAAFVSAPVSGGQKKATARIPLQLAVVYQGANQAGVYWDVTLTNTTTSTIPKGTMIHWTVCPEHAMTRSGENNGSGSFNLPAALAPGGDRSWRVMAPNCTQTPRAWYFK